jgi:two-component system, cell cycle response regulator DivK
MAEGAIRSPSSAIPFSGERHDEDRPNAIFAAASRPRFRGTVTQRVVLIVDDQEDNRAIFSALLEYHGYEVVQAENGRQALDLALTRQPGLILMDLHMPVMDGWEATRLLRGDERTSRIPILAVTAEDRTSRARLRDAGFCAFLQKPVHPRSLIRAVVRCLEARPGDEMWIELADETDPLVR